MEADHALLDKRIGRHLSSIYLRDHCPKVDLCGPLTSTRTAPAQQTVQILFYKDDRRIT